MEYQGAINLSKLDQIRFVTIERFRRGELSRSDTATKLNLSERQVTRIATRVREQGLRGVKHGNTGRKPWNKKDASLVQQYVDLYKNIYPKFNYAHAYEMIEAHNGLNNLSYDLFRKACRKEGVGKTRKRRPSKIRLARERFAEEGYMWQMDGSPEKWNGKDEWSLIALIDDATSRVPNANFDRSETTWACMNVVRAAIEANGRPEFILTDRAGWSSSSYKRRQFSQFERACKDLDITVITTSTPESKGRVERLNRTFQDRLIPELDFYQIKSRSDANRYMKQSFIPEWNRRFTVDPRRQTSRYRPLSVEMNLRDIFCIQTKRIVNRDHTVQYKNTKYKLNPTVDMKGKEITILEYEDKSMAIQHAKGKVEFTEFKMPKRRWKKGA